MIYNTGIKPQVQDEICHLAEKYHLDRVILFGSRARGDYWRASDIDLAVSGGDITRFSLDLEEETSTLLTYDVVIWTRRYLQSCWRAFKRKGLFCMNMTGQRCKGWCIQFWISISRSSSDCVTTSKSNILPR